MYDWPLLGWFEPVCCCRTCRNGWYPWFSAPGLAMYMGPDAMAAPTDVTNSFTNHRLLATHGVDNRPCCLSSPKSTPADGISNCPKTACGCVENRVWISLRNDVAPTAIVTGLSTVIPSAFAASWSPGTRD